MCWQPFLKLGLLLPTDEGRAKSLYEGLAEEGHAQGALWMGRWWQYRSGHPAAVQTALRQYRVAAQGGSAAAANEAAWILATTRDDSLRNGVLALELAEMALRAAPRPQAHLIDTYAAALAENGGFEQASLEQAKAIKLLEGRLSDSELRRYRERLALYQNERPFRGPN